MKILVIGDAMVDVYYEGAVTRLNPEKHSAPLVSVSKVTRLPGGAANVAKNLTNLGVDAPLISGKGSIVKSRVVDDSGVICRFDQDDELVSVEAKDLPEELFADLDGLVISDYAKGSLTPYVAGKIKELAKCPIFVDTKQHPAPWVGGATCFFPNATEFGEHAYDYKLAKLTLVKLGGGGAQVYRAGVRSEKFPSLTTVVSNVSGAGDTVVAAFAAAYCALKNLHKSPELEYCSSIFAMQAAAVAVSKPLTYAPLLREILEEFPDIHPEIMGELTGRSWEAEGA